MSTCLQIAMDEFLFTLQDQGVPPEHYAFKCVICGNIQSAASLSKYMSPEKALNTAYFCCEGRFTKKRGCDWTLGGLFQIHKMEVLTEDKNSAVCGILRAQPIFEPASREEAQELMRHGSVMPKLVTLSCDCCGQQQSARHFARLWGSLRKQGWNKGLRDTYFCPKAQCQEHRAVLLCDAGGQLPCPKN